MKKITKYLMMFLMGMFVAVPFASCSDSNNSDDSGDDANDPATYPSAAPASLQNVVQTYLNDVVSATYTSLANNAQILCTKCQTLYTNAKAGTMTQANIDEACEAFKNARKDWEQSEAFLYGAASDKNIDPHIDSWPLTQSEVGDFLTNAAMVAGITGDNPGLFVREHNTGGTDEDAAFDTALGFHGMEFVLFRNGANRTVAALKANETQEGMESVTGLNELAFLAAVAWDLRDKCYQLEYCWLGSEVSSEHSSWLKTNCTDILAEDLVSGHGNSYKANMLATGTTSSNWSTWQGAANEILVGGCSNICQEVYSQKLGQAYRVASGSGSSEDAGDYIESPYSKRSFQDYQDNIYSIKNVLYGSRNTSSTSPQTNSLLNYMKKNNYERIATLSSALNDAIEALESAKNSGIAFVDDPGNKQVQNCITKVQTLDNELNRAATWISRQ